MPRSNSPRRPASPRRPVNDVRNSHANSGSYNVSKILQFIVGLTSIGTVVYWQNLSTQKAIIYFFLRVYIFFICFRITTILITGSNTTLDQRDTKNFKALRMWQKAGVVIFGLPVYVAIEVIPKVATKFIKWSYRVTINISNYLVDLISRISRGIWDMLINIITWCWNELIVPMYNAVTDALIWCWNKVSAILNWCWDAWVKLINIISDMLSWIWNSLVVPLYNLIVRLFTNLINMVELLWNVLCKMLKQMWRLCAEAFTFFWVPIRNWCWRRWEQIKYLTWFIWVKLGGAMIGMIIGAWNELYGGICSLCNYSIELAVYLWELLNEMYDQIYLYGCYSIQLIQEAWNSFRGW